MACGVISSSACKIFISSLSSVDRVSSVHHSWTLNSKTQFTGQMSLQQQLLWMYFFFIISNLLQRYLQWVASVCSLFSISYSNISFKWWILLQTSRSKMYWPISTSATKICFIFSLLHQLRSPSFLLFSYLLHRDLTLRCIVIALIILEEFLFCSKWKPEKEGI